MSGDGEPVDGELVDRGEFRLDERRAREKLRNYQLPSPHHYILEFVKAANLLGATSFQATVGRSEVVVEFDGQLLGREQFEELYSAAFSSGTSRHPRALRHLAVGINAAWGAGLRDLVIDVGGDEPFAIAVGEDSIRAARITGAIPEGMRIRLEKRLHQAVLLRFIDQLGGDFKESRLLSERARYSTTDIVLNGSCVSQGLTPRDDILTPHRFEADGEKGVVGMTRNGYGAVIRLVDQGVLIEDDAEQSPFAPFGIRALVESDHFDTDLSRNAVVENDALADLRRRVEAAAQRSLADHLMGLSHNELADERASIRSLAVRVLADREGPERDSEHFEVLADVIGELPVFRRAVKSGGEPSFISINQACRVRDGETVAHFSTRQFEPQSELPQHTPILWLDPADPAYDVLPGYTLVYGFLDYYADRFEDVAGEMNLRRRARENRERWQSQPAFEFRASDILQESVGTWSIRVGQAADSPTPATDDDDPRAGSGTRLLTLPATKISFIKEGRLLEQKLLESGAGAFRIAIDGDLPVDEAFEEPDYADHRVRASALEAMELVAQHLRAATMTPDIFCSLLGDFQAALNGAFHLDWEDWSPELLDSPLGIAPALVRRQHPESSQTRIEIQLQRLGKLADEPLFREVGGGRLSLREIFEKLYGGGPDVEFHVLHAPNADELPGDRGPADIVICVEEHVAPAVSHFFSGRSPDDASRFDEQFNVVDRWLDADAIDDDHHLDTVCDDTGELHSRLAYVENAPPAPSQTGQPNDIEASDDGDSRALDGDSTPTLCERLLDDLRQTVPDGFRSRVECIDEMEIIERGGDRAVYVLGDGNHLVLDGAHPAIGHAVEAPGDPVARAFAASTVFKQLLKFDVEHGRRSMSAPRRLAVVRSVLESCTERFR